MVRLVRSLLRTVSKLLNSLFSLCSLVPLHVADNERIIRAIYSPYHVSKQNRLKHQAYDPTPKTDEISTMRFEYMGQRFCKRKAKSFEDPKVKKEYRGFAILSVRAIRKAKMQVIDSRKWYCGHADIKLLIGELIQNREPQEPLSAEAGKRLKDLKNALLAASKYLPDPNPRASSWRGGKFKSN